MARPVCKFPKQPTGPSGFGATGVRRAQDVGGGSYQRTRPDTSTLSIQSGDFSRVIVDDVPEYLTSAVDTDLVVREVKRHQMPFSKSPWVKQSIIESAPLGFYFSLDTSALDLLGSTFTYTVRPGVTESVNFERRRFDFSVNLDGYRAGRRRLSTYEITYSYLPLTPGNTIYLKTGDELSYYGRTDQNGYMVVATSIARFGRVDSVGRQLSDLTVIQNRQKSAGIVQDHIMDPLDFTRPEAEFMWITRQVVLKQHTAIVFAETFFRPGVWNGTDDVRPKLWIATTPNDATFGAFAYHDMTASIFGGGRIPTELNFSGTLFFNTTSGRPYQFDLSRTMFTMRVGATGNDQFVMAWQQRMPTGWRMRVAHVSVAGGTAVGTLTHESSDNASTSLVEFWQDFAHLGNGVVLAKIASGIPGINHTITFRRSLDRGQSWGSAFSPSGFDAPLLNQYFGNFRIHRAADENGPGRVLITSWNPAESRYHVYASDDNGQTWERKGKIYTPDSFLRIDTMEAGDGGGNFDDLAPGPKTELDPTLPERYEDRP
jgi:hypothetical protein